jgi:hypothetical protein
MLFKLLKLFGLDIPAKVAAAKSAIEQRAEEVADYAKEATQTAAVIAALSVLAGISGAMALGVGLLEVYRLVAESFGVNTGLGVVAGVFVAVAVILLLIAWAKEQSLANRSIFKALTPSPAAASSSAPVAAAEGPASASPGAGGPRPEPARDLLEPLAFLLAKYVRYPALGNPVLDEFVGSLRTTARGAADEAVERAANLVRYGNRGQLLVLLSGAAVVGWLLARQNEGLRDITVDR